MSASSQNRTFDSSRELPQSAAWRNVLIAQWDDKDIGEVFGMARQVWISWKHTVRR